LVVADEPTGNLDSHTAGEIFDLFEKLVDQGKTLLVVSHDKEISRYARRTIEIIDGHVVGTGQINPTYTRDQISQ
jgi:putative ABC transport system ATP-binding protein